jgi:hypothetical protein
MKAAAFPLRRLIATVLKLDPRDYALVHDMVQGILEAPRVPIAKAAPARRRTSARKAGAR